MTRERYVPELRENTELLFGETLDGCTPSTSEHKSSFYDICEREFFSVSRVKEENTRENFDRFLNIATTPWESQVQDDVTTAAAQLRHFRSELDIHNLEAVLLSMGYSVCIRRGLSAGGSEHKFLMVSETTRESYANSRHALIDIFFRDIFEIPRSSKSYNAMMSALPQIFVGSCPSRKVGYEASLGDISALY
ncbi:hypothetical protein CYMTET_52676 [Cymbomonas tetramitiformis]|uniref:Uncharacterized protein n=1 Tax=Cymbomonas tetramitiformis TaxID=36881 RepID=A0AAE0BJW3_9CHLO|nr:hypothetical protein CYMTET_52676 [Cymbomonas tetramitiformis]